MPSIFISYRRSDSMAYTGRIYDRLVSAFGEKNIFKDVEDIPAGMDFREVLDKALTASDVVLVIIGQQWLYVADDRGKRRLADPNDFVRLEVETALKRSNVLVVPVLINNAPMPTADQLPGGLKELAFRNSVVIRDDPDFNRDITTLLKAIQSRAKPNRLPLLLGIGAALVIVALLAVLLLSRGGGAPPEPTAQAALPTEAATQTLPPTESPTQTVAPTDAPSATPAATEEPTSAAAAEPTMAFPDGRALAFFYDENTFVVQNPGNAQITFRPLAFEALDASGQPTSTRFEGAKWDAQYEFLLRGGCGSIERPQAARHLEPEACRTYNARVSNVSSGELFWLASSGPAFRVLWDGAEIGRCDSAAGTCSLNIPPA